MKKIIFFDEDYDYDDFDFVKQQIDEVVTEPKDDEQYLIVADLGLWDGRVKAYKTKSCKLSEIISRLCEDYNSCYLNNKGLFLDAAHHDGINHFEIRILTERGQDLDDRYSYGEEKIDVDKIRKYPYSKRLTIRR